jgi:hypothetical protein
MTAKSCLRFLPALFVFLTLCFSARAAGRLALVIGVGDYDGKFGLSALPGIAHDVAKMKASLEAVGFTVTTLENPTLTQAEEAIDTFGQSLKANKGVGLFYFSGHGGEFEGKNYLIPKGARLTSARDIKEQGVAAQRILGRMEDAGNGTNILFLDCCRNTMTKAATDSGMAAMNAKGTFIGFATASEKTAAASTDGSPYTGSLSRFMLKKGVSITDMHTMVTRDVENVTREGGAEVQTPFQYSGLNDVFYFVPADAAAPTVPDIPAAPPVPFVPPKVPTTNLTVQKFFIGWWDHQSSDDASVWASDFRNPCDYCYSENGPATRAFIIQDRQKLINRYTRRLTRLVEAPTFTISEDGKTANLFITFDYRFSGKKEASGRAKVTLGLSWDGSTWGITRYHEAVTRRAFDDTPPPAADSSGSKAALQGFVTRWWEHQSSDDPAVWAADFRNPCNYCYADSGKASRTFIMQDRQKLINRYTRRVLRLVEQPDVRLSQDGRTASMSVRFTYAYSGAKNASGTTTVSTDLSWDGSSWGITRYDEKLKRD